MYGWKDVRNKVIRNIIGILHVLKTFQSVFNKIDWGHGLENGIVGQKDFWEST